MEEQFLDEADIHALAIHKLENSSWAWRTWQALPMVMIFFGGLGIYIRAYNEIIGTIVFLAVMIGLLVTFLFFYRKYRKQVERIEGQIKKLDQIKIMVDRSE